MAYFTLYTDAHTTLTVDWRISGGETGTDYIGTNGSKVYSDSATVYATPSATGWTTVYLTLNKNDNISSVTGGGSARIYYECDNPGRQRVSSTTTFRSSLSGSATFNISATLGSATGYNYSFSGWYNGSTRISYDQTTNVTISQNTTLTARGTKSAKSFTVTLDPSGGTNSSPSKIYGVYNDAYYTNSAHTHAFTSLTSLPSKSGWIFKGFYWDQYLIINPDGTPNANFTTTFSSGNDRTLYAVWEGYKLYLHPDDNTASVSPGEESSHGGGTSVNISATLKNIPGYKVTWKGWYWYDGGFYDVYDYNQSTTIRMPYSSFSLYTETEKKAKSFTVTLDSNGGTSGSPSKIYGVYNDAYYTDSAHTHEFTSLRSLPSKTGWIFDGFYWDQYLIINPDGTPNANFTTTFSSGDDRTLYATWKNTGAVSFINPIYLSSSGSPAAGSITIRLSNLSRGSWTFRINNEDIRTYTNSDSSEQSIDISYTFLYLFKNKIPNSTVYHYELLLNNTVTVSGDIPRQNYPDSLKFEWSNPSQISNGSVADKAIKASDWNTLITKLQMVGIIEDISFDESQFPLTASPGDVILLREHFNAMAAAITHLESDNRVGQADRKMLASYFNSSTGLNGVFNKEIDYINNNYPE